MIIRKIIRIDLDGSEGAVGVGSVRSLEAGFGGAMLEFAFSTGHLSRALEFFALYGDLLKTSKEIQRLVAADFKFQLD